MVVAMVAVRMMKMPVYKVIDVVSMRHGFMSAIRTVDVSCFMSATLVVRRTAVRVLCTNVDVVLVDMVPVWMMQVTIMQVIDMVVMHDTGVTAVVTVLMAMVFVVFLLTGIHNVSFFSHSVPCSRAFWIM